MDPCDELQDPLKPVLPYTAGARLDIQPHVPPEPAVRANTGIPACVENSPHSLQQQYGAPSRICLARSPPITQPHPDPTSLPLTVIDQLVARDGRGPQLVKCRVGRYKGVLVAKIYDPLYYNWRDAFDGVADASRDYSREVTAYGVLAGEGRNGELTPRYFGAWTFDTPLLDGSLRQVRMILVDYIPLPNVLSLILSGRVQEISPDARMQILATVLEHCSRLLFYGVCQNDLAPRNILVDPEWEGDQPRLFIIDFGRARLRDINYFSSSLIVDKERPDFPGTGFAWSWRDFYEWVPEKLRSSKRRIEWFQQQWGNSETFEPPDARELSWWNQAIDSEDREQSGSSEESVTLVTLHHSDSARD